MAVLPRKLLMIPDQFCQQKCPGHIVPDDPSCFVCKKCTDYPCDSPYSEIFPPPPPPPTAGLDTHPNKHATLRIFLTVAIAILAAAFFFFTIFTVYRFYSYWSRSRRRRSGRREAGGNDGPTDFLDEAHGPELDHPIWYIRTVGLDPTVIGAITVVKYKKGEGLIDGTDCSVCLNEFQEDETLRLLPKCSHAFHVTCIDTWLRSHINCPLCRARIVVDTTASFPFPPQAAVVQTEETVIAVSDSDREAEDEASGSPSTVQPVRRSVSVDSLSASMISSAMAEALRENSEKQLGGEKESASGRVKERNGAMQTAGPSAVRRTLSCSAKVFLSRHSSRSRSAAGMPQ